MTKVQRDKQFPLSADEKAILHRAANKIWDEVAYDMMSALAEEGKSSISRSHVIEIVHDAGRLEEAVKQARIKCATPTPGLEALFPPYKSDTYVASADAVDSYLKDVFTYSRYGM